MGITADQEKWILFVLLLVTIAYPVINPLGLPLKIDEMNNNFFDIIDNLPPGSNVWFENDLIPSIYSEFYPSEVAIITHLLQKDAKIMIVSTNNPTAIQVLEGPVFTALSLRPEFKAAKYGEDYVHLGFIPGGEIGLSALAKDIKSLVSVDYRGNSLSDLPMMKDLNSVEDFDLVIACATISPINAYMRQVQGPYDITVIVHAATMDVPSVMPYYPNQITELLKGGRGAAEYEVLLGRPFYAVSSQDAVSISHMMLFCALVVAQINYYREYLSKKDK